jgi:hypothetical protein
VTVNPAWTFTTTAAAITSANITSITRHIATPAHTTSPDGLVGYTNAFNFLQFTITGTDFITATFPLVVTEFATITGANMTTLTVHNETSATFTVSIDDPEDAEAIVELLPIAIPNIT